MGMVALTLCACAPPPHDPDATTRHVERQGRLRAGLVAGVAPGQAERMRRLAGDIAQAHHARLDARTGPAGALMRDLEAGRLDLVVGVFPKRSPWSRRVAFSAPFPKADVAKDTPVVRVAVHPGENRWLMGIERTIAAQSGGEQG